MSGTSTKKVGVGVGFVLMLLVLIGNAIYTRNQVANQMASEQWVEHTRRVMLKLSEIESLLKDAETGQRGYIYTHDSKYLTPYSLAAQQVQPNLEELADLTRDNPRQQEQIGKLRLLIQKKMSELAQTIEMVRTNDDIGARRVVTSDVGLVLMQEIGATLGRLRAEEESLERRRTSEYERSAQGTYRAIKTATGMAIVALAFLAYYIVHEMNERRRHARQLLEREEWFRVTLNSLGDAVVATDAEGRVTYVNPLAEEMMGATLAEVKDRPIEQVFAIYNEHTLEPVQNPIGKVLKHGHIIGLANHTVLKRPDGTMSPIEDSAAPIRDHHDNILGAVLVFRDATQERRAEKALRESEKLTSAARMSATVAHEINNPLEAVGNLIYLAKDIDNMPPEAVQHLELAEQELERVAHITKQTLGFYREAKVHENVNIPELIDYVIRLHKNKISNKRITVERDYGSCPLVKGMAGELKQVIANLLSNAADAVNEGGKITFRINCVIEPDHSSASIVVEDDGPGIPDKVADHIFEPFFTTKKDIGNGLGLWVSKEIIERHGGRLQLYPRGASGNGGAAFHITLPGAIV